MKKLLMCCMVVLLATAFVSAQVRTGNIYGKITDKEGAVLPGIMVTVTGSLTAPVSTVSNESGVYRFNSLAAASDYTITAELESFKKQVRNGISVNVGVNTEVNLVMELGVITDTVIVNGSAPVVDARSTAVAAIVTRTELQSLPTGRDPFIVMAMAPGVQTDRENMAGSESGQQATSVGRGQNGYNNNTWNVDGVNVTDPGSLGATPTYWDFDAFEEMNVTVGGPDISFQTNGINLNMVTRRGGNRQSLGGRFYLTDSTFQDVNFAADDARRAEMPAGALGVNGIRQIKDYGFNLGGPLVKDAAYYWLSYGVQDIKTLSFSGGKQDFLLANYAGKFNMQIIPTNRFEVFYHVGGKTAEGRSASASWPQGQNQTNQTHWGSPVLKIQDEQTFGSNLFLSVRYSHSDAGFKLIPVADPNLTQIAVLNEKTRVNSSTGWLDIKRPRDNFSGTFTYFNDKFIGGAHELKFGFEYTKMETTGVSGMFTGGSGSSSSTWAFSTTGTILRRTNLNNPYFDTGVPSADWNRVMLGRPKYYNNNVKQYSAFFQDSMTYDNFMIRIGLRLDIMQPGLGDLNIGALDKNDPATKGLFETSTLATMYDLFPPATSAAVSPTNWKMTVWSPRLAITWDMTRDGKNILKLSGARTGDVMGTGTGQNFFPFGASAWMNLWWNDKAGNNDGKINFNEIYWRDASGAPYRIFDNAGAFIQTSWDTSHYMDWAGFNPASPSAMTPSNKTMKQNESSNTYELLLTYEREIMKDLAASIDLNYRYANNFFYEYKNYNPTTGVAIDNADIYVASGKTIPTQYTRPDGKVINAGPLGGTQFYVYKPYTQTSYSIFENRAGYSNTYMAADLNILKRLSNKWMGTFGVTLQKQTQHYADNDLYNYQNLALDQDAALAPYIGGASGKESQYVYSRYMFKASGLYQLPWDLNVSFTAVYHEGNVIDHTFTVRDNSLGGDKNLNSAFIRTQAFGSDRLDPIFDLTLRLEKQIKIGENENIYIMFDLFNVLNSSTVIARYQSNQDIVKPTGVLSSPYANYGKIYNLLNPRVFRLGVRFQF